MSDGRSSVVVAERPNPGTPRGYEFPPFRRDRLANGMSVLVVDVPGRPLVSALLVLANGAIDEASEFAGATVLAARALTEGTERHDAVGLTEAAERLGASLHADAGWDATTIGVDVPIERLGPALELVAEVATMPTFPAAEVERLRDERLNDLLQARADPRRRAEEVFADTIYAASSAYHRPSGGTPETVRGLERESVRAAYLRGADPANATLVVAGELGGTDVVELSDRLFGRWPGVASGRSRADVEAEPATRKRRVRVIHRPGAVQTEIRIGHVGLRRRTPDFHAVSVMSAILGGLFNSRLNMKLREEKGYTYGAGAGFDLRRGPGPFAARAAVQTPVTVPAVLDTLAELDAIRSGTVRDAELAAARDFLVGVFPLRFETPGAIVGALSGIVVHDLPDDELARYRDAIEAVTIDDVEAAARTHVRPDEAQVVLVGDADAFLADLEAASLGELIVERDSGPAERATEEGVEGQLGPVDREDEPGLPTEPEDAPGAPVEGVPGEA
ncbi:MAG TPA: pitrilysin family protein [Candidatus Limnocylindrales bacterium]|nr:pitrilysin family protein [Candidatus Limnocylindrales bacterium]